MASKERIIMELIEALRLRNDLDYLEYISMAVIKDTAALNFILLAINLVKNERPLLIEMKGGAY